MFGIVGLENISGGNFYEVLQSLVSVYLPGGRRIAEILSDYAVLFLLLGIVVGVSQCFFGYKLRRVWTGILLTVLCGCGGAALASEFGLPVAALVGITALAALIGGLVGYFLWITGCFLRPFAVVSIAVFSVFVIYQLQTLGLIVGLAAGLIAGILVTAFYKIGLRLYTAVFGGLFIGECVWELTGLSPWYPALAIGGVFALVGFGVQIFTGRKAKGETAVSGEEMAAEGSTAFFTEGQTSEGGMAGGNAVFSTEGQAFEGRVAGGNAAFSTEGQASEGRMAGGNAVFSIEGQAFEGRVAGGNAAFSPEGQASEGRMTGGNAAFSTEGQASEGRMAGGNSAFLAEGRTSERWMPDGAVPSHAMTEAAATAESGISMPEGIAAAGQISPVPSGEDGKNVNAAAGFCPSCGTPYSARAKFCMQCGRKISNGAK